MAVIVQLREMPLLSKRRIAPSLIGQMGAQELRDHQTRILEDQKGVRDWIRTQEPSLRERDFQTFRFTFNGMATTVSRETLRRLKHHPAVARVFADRKTRAALADSVPVTGAPRMWTDFGATGQGIRVAIIDTGIDYNHPDLGGGLGPGKKVLGGHDFVNGDNDPMDDNGHGTHVAGIVAGNGLTKGVAPGASLLAYKVLGADGYGLGSQVIAAIDRASDPDQDPLTDDKVQVINLSLGSPGDPDDPVSQAVDAATANGIVCVVAAGNTGSGYSTIDSPGCARTALTVGATDNTDQIAGFSSRGPNQPDLGIKPDLTAPGVAINAPAPGGGFAVKSGTSMATPHVAGAAALLRQLHPTWTPAVLKGVLMGKAKDLGLDAFTQGSGRLQIAEAHQAKAVALPSALAFGLVDPAQGLWSRTLNLTLTSLDSTSRTYSLAVTGTWTAGVTWQVQPASVSLAPGQAVPVSVTLTVDNSVAPFGEMPTMGFTGRFAATAPDDAWSLPVSYHKAHSLELAFTERPTQLLIFDRNADPTDGFDQIKFDWNFEETPTPESFRFIVPPRAYDVLCRYWGGPNGTPGERWIVREGVVVDGYRRLDIDAQADPIHRLTFTPTLADGSTLATEGNQRGSTTCLVHRSGHLIEAGFGWTEDVYITDVSSDYRLEKVHAVNKDTIGPYFEMRYGLAEGIHASAIVRNAPLVKPAIDFNGTVPQGPVAFAFHPALNQDLINAYYGPSWVRAAPGERPDVNISLQPYPGYSYQTLVTVHPWEGDAPDLSALPAPVFKSQYLGWDSAGSGVFDIWERTHALIQIPGDRLTLGEAPYLFTGRISRCPAGLSMGSPVSPWMPLFMSQTGGGLLKPLAFEHRVDGNLVQTATLAGIGSSNWPQVLEFPLAGEGHHQVTVTLSDYPVHGTPGVSTARIAFTSDTADSSAPFLRMVQVLESDVPTSRLTQGAPSRIQLAVEDETDLAQVQVSYKTGEAWIPLAVPAPAGRTLSCSVDLPSLPVGLVSLKLSAVDGTGNTLEQVMEPAFHVGPALAPPTLDQQPQDLQVPVGAAATFSVTASGTGPLTYQWRRDGNDIAGAVESSYTTPPVGPADQGAAFSVVVSNPSGSITSRAAMLSVLLPPSITTQPLDASAWTGQTAAFAVVATGTGTLTYQWRRNGEPIAGADQATYQTTPVSSADHGARFSVQVANAHGTATSVEAVLSVPTVLVAVAPNLTACLPGEALTFSASVTHASDQRVQWSASAGAIDSQGRWAAPDTAATVTVTAASLAEPASRGTATIVVKGTDFDGNSATRPRLLGIANALGSTDPGDLQRYDFNGDGRIDDLDLAKLFQKMGW